MLSRCSPAVSLVLHFPSCLFSPLLKCLFSSEHLVIPSGPRPHRAALCLCAVPYSRGRFTEMEPCVCGLLKLALFTEEPVTLCLFQANLLFVFLHYLPDACSQIYVFVRSAASRTQSLEHVGRTWGEHPIPESHAPSPVVASVPSGICFHVSVPHLNPLEQNLTQTPLPPPPHRTLASYRHRK